MENKSGKGLIILVALIAVVIALVGGYSLGKGVFTKNVEANKSNEQEKKEDSQEIKNGELDLNSDIVKELYFMVTPIDDVPQASYMDFYEAYRNYWNHSMFYPYEDNVDFIASTANEEDKMYILSWNLDVKKKTKYNCEKYKQYLNKWVHKIGNGEIIEDYNKCNLPEELQSTNPNEYDEYTEGFTREYIESLYKKIYGKDAVLDKSVTLYTNCPVYIYNSKMDAYIDYTNGCGGTEGPGGYSHELIKAIKDDNSIKIYDKVVYTDYDEDDTENENPITKFVNNYIYTFEKEDTGNYIFVSRTIER